MKNLKDIISELLEIPGATITITIPTGLAHESKSVEKKPKQISEKMPEKPIPTIDTIVETIAANEVKPIKESPVSEPVKTQKDQLLELIAKGAEAMKAMKYDEALEHFQQAKRMDPANKYVIRDITKCIVKSIEVNIANGDKAMDEKQYETALEFYSKAAYKAVETKTVKTIQDKIKNAKAWIARVAELKASPSEEPWVDSPEKVQEEMTLDLIDNMEDQDLELPL